MSSVSCSSDCALLEELMNTISVTDNLTIFKMLNVPSNIDQLYEHVQKHHLSHINSSNYQCEFTSNCLNKQSNNNNNNNTIIQQYHNKLLHVNDDEYIKPITPSEQKQIFVGAYMPHQYPKDIISLISNRWLDPEFQWRLGLLQWNSLYKNRTQDIVEEIYGSNSNILKLINYGISKCITHKQFDRVAIRKDIMETSANKSWLVYFIIKSISPHCRKGLELYGDKWKIHHMLYQIVSPRHEIISTRHYSYDSYGSYGLTRDIRVMALECIPSPDQAFELQSSITMVSMSPLTLPNIMNDLIQNDMDSSFILDTLKHEYPERDESDIERLHKLLLAFNRTPSTKDIQYITMDIDENIKEILAIDAWQLLKKECVNFLPFNSEYGINKPFVIAKIIDIINRKGVIMNIINLFTELRMASHYIEMLKRKHCEWIVNCASITIENNENENDQNDVIIYENILSISEFLRNYPLFETLRSQFKYDHIIHCLISVVTHIVNKVMRPLPFKPTHIINDSYSDYLMYTSQISRFIYNKIVNQNRFNKFKYFDDTILNSLHFPVQFDFLIIPQCVSEHKINSNESNPLLFGIGNDFVGNIADILQQFNIKFKQFEIDREPAQFYKTLTRGFHKIQKKSNTKRHQRYIFIIDRRAPQFDGKYYLNNNEKNWKDKLYIYSPPEYNSISSQCNISPEGFINRTMQYLLPLSDNITIGANCVANGYIFVESYHLFQEDKIKKYFHYNGYSQRFTKDELKYYLPRLFMKIDGKFQHELHVKNNKASLQMFKEIKDEEHQMFHQQTMK